MRLKDIVEINRASLPETTNPNYSFRYIDIGNVSSDGVICLSKEMKFSESPSRARRIVKKGDVLVSTVRTYLRAISCINDESNDLIASTGFAVCTPKESVNNRFLDFAIRTDSVIDSICKNSTGVSYPAITASCLGSITVPFYSLIIQKQIVNYLDRKVKSIENRISILTKQRDAYTRLKTSNINCAVTRGLNKNAELKDSGVEWIGKIPVHWKTKRLKDLAYLYSGLTGKSGEDFRCDDETKTKPFIPFTNILNNTMIDISNVNFVVMDKGEVQNKVCYHDLLFLMSSEDYESIAKSAVVVQEPGELYLNSFCRGLHFTSEEVYSPFVNYQLSASNYRDALRFEARGFTRINIKVDRIASMFVSLPPLSEQQAIAAYLNDKCAKIDSAITNIDKQIDAMKRLKRALINEVVTGKRKV